MTITVPNVEYFINPKTGRLRQRGWGDKFHSEIIFLNNYYCLINTSDEDSEFLGFVPFSFEDHFSLIRNQDLKDFMLRISV